MTQQAGGGASQNGATMRGNHLQMNNASGMKLSSGVMDIHQAQQFQQQHLQANNQRRASPMKVEPSRTTALVQPQLAAGVKRVTDAFERHEQTPEVNITTYKLYDHHLYRKLHALVYNFIYHLMCIMWVHWMTSNFSTKFAAH
jgi:hypothetical protein